MNDNDLITRREVELVLLEKGQRSRRYRIGEIWELSFDEIREALQECQPKLVRCNGCKYLNTPANGVPFCKRIKKFVDENWFCGDGDMIETNQESAEDVTGLYCDDITFCWGPCDRFKCPRNKYNIRDKRVPHSFFAEGVVPDDCPKLKENEDR